MSTGAPVVPGAPPTTRTEPAVNFESRGAPPRHLPEQRRRWRAGPLSATARARCRRRRRPRRESGPERRGDRPCSMWNVTVNAASTATPETSPVDASTPEGMSTETTGAPRAVDALDQRGRLGVAASRGSRCRRGRRRRRRRPRPRRSRPPRGPRRAGRAPRPCRHRRSTRRRRRRRTAARTGTRAWPRTRRPAPARSINSGTVSG